MGEQGGWPLTMFLTPEGEPFWGGTYFPPEPRWGRPGFPAGAGGDQRGLCRRNATMWRRTSRRCARRCSGSASRKPARAIARALFDRIAERLLREVDPINGGIGTAPKFPQCGIFELLWRGWKRTGETAYRDAVLTDADDDLPGRHLRPSRRRLRPLFDRRALAGAAFREDALRQCRAGRSADPGLAGDARPALRASGSPRRSAGSSARCGRRAAASPAASMPTASTRRASSTSGPRPRSTRCSATDAAVVQALLRRRRRRAIGRATRSSTGCITPALADAATEDELARCRELLLRGAGAAGAARARRQGAGRLERADDRGAGRCRAGVRAARLARRSRARAFAFVREPDDGAPTDGCSTAGATAAPAIRPVSTITPISAAPRWRSTRRRPTRRYLAQARDWVAMLDRHYWDAAGGGYFFAADDTRGADRPRQDRRRRGGSGRQRHAGRGA